MKFIQIPDEDKARHVFRLPGGLESYGIIELEDDELLTLADLEAANGGGPVIVVKFKEYTVNLDRIQLEYTHFYSKSKTGMAYDVCDFSIDSNSLEWKEIVYDEGTSEQVSHWECLDLPKIERICEFYEFAEQADGEIEMEVIPHILPPPKHDWSSLSKSDIESALARFKTEEA